MKKIALPRLLALMLAMAMAAWASLPAAADAPLVTITGTVVSLVDEVLVVSTDKGNLTFDLDKSTEMPAALAVGNRITVSYDSDDNPADRMDARKIVMAPVATTPSVTPAPTTPTPTPAPVVTTPAPVVEEEPSELPATASPLPLMGAVGLLSLAGGLLLRKRERRN